MKIPLLPWPPFHKEKTFLTLKKLTEYRYRKKIFVLQHCTRHMATLPRTSTHEQTRHTECMSLAAERGKSWPGPQGPPSTTPGLPYAEIPTRSPSLGFCGADSIELLTSPTHITQIKATEVHIFLKNFPLLWKSFQLVHLIFTVDFKFTLENQRGVGLCGGHSFSFCLRGHSHMTPTAGWGYSEEEESCPAFIRLWRGTDGK